MLITASSSEMELFAAATQLYVRLRRVNGRVIDIQYMMENLDYAKYVIKYAENIQDNELMRYLNRVKEFYTTTDQVMNVQHVPISEQTKTSEKTSPQPRQWFLG